MMKFIRYLLTARLGLSGGHEVPLWVVILYLLAVVAMVLHAVDVQRPG